MPSRTDISGMDFHSAKLRTNWPWLEEVASSTNALLGLVEVNKVSGTNGVNDTLADECVGISIFSQMYRVLTTFFAFSAIFPR
jgi:hypothetical protein